MSSGSTEAVPSQGRMDWRAAVADAARRMGGSPSDEEVTALTKALAQAPASDHAAVALRSKLRIRRADVADLKQFMGKEAAGSIMGFGPHDGEKFREAVKAYRGRLANLRAAGQMWRLASVDSAALERVVGALLKKVEAYERWGPTGELAEKAAGDVLALRVLVEREVRGMAFWELSEEALELVGERAANLEAEFLPADPADEEARPMMWVGGAAVLAYWEDGVLHVVVDVDDVPDARTVEGRVPVEISMGRMVLRLS
ncbi:hypothetical protein [Streptomyces albidoflavus]|uniref:hypothetical protein n=1 Tax=Streptomyces albidoflavus TaxID=1886 RepID=UPI003406C988